MLDRLNTVRNSTKVTKALHTLLLEQANMQFIGHSPEATTNEINWNSNSFYYKNPSGDISSIQVYLFVYYLSVILVVHPRCHRTIQFQYQHAAILVRCIYRTLYIYYSIVHPSTKTNPTSKLHSVAKYLPSSMYIFAPNSYKK